MAGACGAQTAC
jgi:hypothetical protein